jgi:hypothetical protein
MQESSVSFGHQCGAVYHRRVPGAQDISFPARKEAAGEFSSRNRPLPFYPPAGADGIFLALCSIKDSIRRGFRISTGRTVIFPPVNIFWKRAANVTL